MCVICVKPKGKDLPTVKQITAMWRRNPDGAGFMYTHDGVLHVKKGFTDITKFLEAIDVVDKEDVAVLHFRISTQGFNKEMTHPFVLSTKLEDMKELEWVGAPIGIAHNGIIQLTTDHREVEYSDTALFITNYLTRIIRKPSDLDDQYIQDIIEITAGGTNKFAILRETGEYTLIGKFTEIDGLLYSNTYHLPNPWLDNYNLKRFTLLDNLQKNGDLKIIRNGTLEQRKAKHKGKK